MLRSDNMIIMVIIITARITHTVSDAGVCLRVALFFQGMKPAHVSV